MYAYSPELEKVAGGTPPPIEQFTIQSKKETLAPISFSNIEAKKWVDLILKYGGEIKKSQGISEVDIQKMSKTAICKINMDTDLRLAHTAGVREDMKLHPEHFDQRDYNKAGKTYVKEQIAHAIELVEGK